MLIQIDSGFRDYQKFPYNSDMTISINGRPIGEKNDIRSTNITENFIQSAFQWVGNSDKNNPISKISNDTFRTKIIPVNSNQCLIIPENDDIRKLINTIDYFVGIELWIEETNQTSKVIFYNKNLFLITLDEDVFTVYFENLSLEDCVNNENMENFAIDGYFVNTSFHEKRNLILLGITKTNFQPMNKFVISTGAYRGLIVENVTKNWKREIVEINGIFRHVILDNIPSYDSNDFFILYKEPTLIRNEKKEFFRDGIETFSILSFVNTPNYLEKYRYKNIVMKVVKENPLQLQIIHPGDDITEKEIILKSVSGNEIKINIESIGSGFIMKEDMSISSELYILSLLDTFSNNVEYFTIQSLNKNIVYIDYSIKETIFETVQYLYFIPYRSVFPNLVIPTVPTQNLICVETQLISLVLPNLPICGYNIYLADIPYVFVNLCNSQGQGCEITSTIYSNVPAATSNNFVCPIANVRNPRLNFVILNCKQKAIFKFSPRDTLRFRVSLPNGEILKYVNNKYAKLFDCPPLDIPLNLNRKRNEKIIFPYILNNSISAVFEMRFLR